MVLEQDLVSGATYVRLMDAEVARTVSVDDLISVDVDARGDVVGIEFAFPIKDATAQNWQAVFTRFPDLKTVVPGELLA